MNQENKTRTDFSFLPRLPDNAIKAAARGALVPFIGAGVSRLVGGCSWDELARNTLNQLCSDNHGKELSYGEINLLDKYPPKIRLSIAKDISEGKQVEIKYKELLGKHDGNLGIFQSILHLGNSFVTTNYDEWLEDASEVSVDILNADKTSDNIKSNSTEIRKQLSCHYKPAELKTNLLLEKGHAFHIHGIASDQESMVISTRDYIKHYRLDGVNNFLDYLFDKCTVLFIGYSLQEIEILDYVFSDRLDRNTGSQVGDHIWLVPFFSYQEKLFDILKIYYRNHCNVELIGYLKDKNSYNQLNDVLKSWADILVTKPAEFSEKSKIIDRAF